MSMANSHLSLIPWKNISYEYDALGGIEKVLDDGEPVVEFLYNNFGYPTSKIEHAGDSNYEISPRMINTITTVILKRFQSQEKLMIPRDNNAWRHL